MQAELVAYTQANPALTPEAAAGRSDLSAVAQGQGAWPERLIEYAGRVCYRSTHRMGTAPDFIAARVREGHEDIIEHVVITLRLREAGDVARWRLLNRHCEISEVGAGEWLVSGNTRVWLDLLRQGAGREVLPLVQSVAPKVYAEFGEAAASAPALEQAVTDLTALAPSETGNMRVTLLGFTQPLPEAPELALHHGAATFLFEGISRTCTHQLVRHRLASFSQESQRYVDLSKGEWDAVVPRAVAENPEAMAVMESFWVEAEQKYAALRKLGIRKEDARFLLPNAAETRIVATMNFAGWSHFFWLRAVDTAAQWEIRSMGQQALAMLYSLAPAVFQSHWDVYLEKFKEQQ